MSEKSLSFTDRLERLVNDIFEESVMGLSSPDGIGGVIHTVRVEVDDLAAYGTGLTADDAKRDAAKRILAEVLANWHPWGGFRHAQERKGIPWTSGANGVIGSLGVTHNKYLCPSCGNRETFRVEAQAYADYEVGKGLGANGFFQGFPFNGRIVCRKCEAKGRTNTWMRGAYVEEEKRPEANLDRPGRYPRLPCSLCRGPKTVYNNKCRNCGAVYCEVCQGVKNISALPFPPLNHTPCACSEENQDAT